MRGLEQTGTAAETLHGILRLKDMVQYFRLWKLLATQHRAA